GFKRNVFTLLDMLKAVKISYSSFIYQTSVSILNILNVRKNSFNIQKSGRWIGKIFINQVT
ncbi:MAG TPA: hypothetical protein VFI29_11940, partial [Hanamia sp.]|nr:hypothetical protein [Hanamia sp.]